MSGPEEQSSPDAKPFYDNTYLADLTQRHSSAALERSTAIEWTFGIVGVLVAASVVTMGKGTILSPLLVLFALALTIPLASLATRAHLAIQSLGVVKAHVTYMRYSKEVLPGEITETDFGDHLADVAEEVELKHARVQTRLSSILNVLAMGPGYLFGGALLVFLYQWNLYWPLIGHRFSPIAAVMWIIPFVPLILITWNRWASLNRVVASESMKRENCPVCKGLKKNLGSLQKDDKFLPRPKWESICD
jgi:hypothetical protein